MTVKLVIKLADRSEWLIDTLASRIKSADGSLLESGKVYSIQYRNGEIAERTVLFKPYYRRSNGSDLTVFAIEVLPKEGA